MSHIRVCESCPTYECVGVCMYIVCATTVCASHVPHTSVWVMSHIRVCGCVYVYSVCDNSVCESCPTYECVLPTKQSEWCFYIYESCPTYECVSPTKQSEWCFYIYESCPTYECVGERCFVVESRRLYECVTSHIPTFMFRWDDSGEWFYGHVSACSCISCCRCGADGAGRRYYAHIHTHTHIHTYTHTCMYGMLRV